MIREFTDEMYIKIISNQKTLADLEREYKTPRKKLSTLFEIYLKNKVTAKKEISQVENVREDLRVTQWFKNEDDYETKTDFKYNYEEAMLEDSRYNRARLIKKYGKKIDY